MRKKFKYFTDNQKYEVIHDYLTSGQSQVEILKKYDIRGKSCITNWMRKFGLKKPNENQFDLKSIMEKESKKSLKEEALEVKIRALEKDLAYEKLRTEALSTMIDIAEQDLKISIRKKSGTKQ